MVTPQPSPSVSLPNMTDLWQKTLHWSPSPEQAQIFQALYRHILDANRYLNLTRITDPVEFSEKHLWDSLRGIIPRFAHPIPLTPSPTPFKAIDIGTGAGFPGIPFAIAQPTWTVTLLDSTRKKIDFLNQLLTTLDIANATAIAGRAEELGQNPDHREQYSLAAIRAVAATPVCAEYALPFLQVGGVAVLYRGQWSVEEQRSLATAIALLGGEIEAIEAFNTPITQAERHCIYVRKISATSPEFPRVTGIPAQKPLG
ncbi:MAG: 16S rRNA (guanine(527)-N(7))-methyltransferase RsmG [Oscillatoriales cyanobacterium C42_A2020_001]|nr:16S rRNA (guanine(527)-N(7))-methyltransferase RsmG [Leptolyngbyaceae cyanobacterium C42_A2020_001]